MRALIVGAGEVGKSLYRVLSDYHETYIRDVQPIPITEQIDVLNICFPYQHGFRAAVEMYQQEYKPAITIIHSTVPPGTSRKLNAVHSPIHGKHPNLDKGILTFVKYVGGVNPDDVALAEQFLREAKIHTMVVDSPETSELSKILCTTQYGWSIVLMKEIKKICDVYEVPFEQVYGWNQFYNDGYQKLGMHQFRRPMLEYSSGQIGGHCVVPNCDLLESDITDFIIKKDEEYKKEKLESEIN